jgi:hypothetical protein
MKRPRVSIAALMAAVAVVAVNIAVWRAIDSSLQNELTFFYAFGALPMAGILILVLVCAARNLLREGRLSPFVFGFEAAGTAAVFAFISAYSIAENAFATYCFVILQWIASFFNADLERSPNWAQVSVAEGTATVVLVLPQLLLALLGGWLAQKLKLTIRFERGEPHVSDPNLNGVTS